MVEPMWPEASFQQLIKLAFRDRVEFGPVQGDPGYVAAGSGETGYHAEAQWVPGCCHHDGDCCSGPLKRQWPVASLR